MPPVFWIPEFLTGERGVNLAANFAGGYLTLRLERRGGSVNRTR